MRVSFSVNTMRVWAMLICDFSRKEGTEEFKRMSWTSVVDVEMMHEKGRIPNSRVTTHEIWNWEKCKAKIMGLRGRLGFQDSPTLRFLGLSLSLKDGMIYDELKTCSHSVVAPSVYCILSGYAEATPIPIHRLVGLPQPIRRR
ncbi:MAG: hypothetical protein AOA65_0698 [Candidatus Bathyarchaeota archaeon BA1]|nr:MAG: hypothetical protein AOA65_0698 [Candidatus Bathyarchaeota archaeon BA1]